MEDVYITITQDITNVDITVDNPDPQENIIVTVAASESNGIEVDELREELGDLNVDLVLNYNIAKL